MVMSLFGDDLVKIIIRMTMVSYDKDNFLNTILIKKLQKNLLLKGINEN